MIQKSNVKVKEFNPKDTKEMAQKQNNEQLRQIIRQQNDRINKLEDRISTLENS